jgi:DNA replication initiation complex subunit (GINS family)
MLTFEKIRDLERAERSSQMLQKLPENILDEFRDYIKRKEQIQNKTDFDIHEIQNAKNTIKRILELREQKILNLALYSVRTGIPPDGLLKHEEIVFNNILNSLKKFREDFFNEIQNEKEEKKEIKDELVVIKTIPTIVGPDLKEYSLKEGEVVKDLPKSLNDLLLKKGIIGIKSS